MVKRAVDRKRAKLIVIDPRKVELVKFAHIWLRPRPGTDVAWLNGLLHVILEEGLWDEKYVAERTEGFEELRGAVAEYTPEYVEQLSGIPAGDLRRAARMYAKAPRAMILYAMGITQHTTGTDNVKSLANLAMLCGNVGIEGGGVNPLRGQNNVQGSCDMGGLPNVLPGYQTVADENVLARFQQAWGTGVRLSGRPGLMMTEMFPAILADKIKAMVVMGENPVLSDANVATCARRSSTWSSWWCRTSSSPRRRSLPTWCCPAASFRREGRHLHQHRAPRPARAQRRSSRPATRCPTGRSSPSWRGGWARQLGGGNGHGPAFGHWDYRSPAEIFDEIASLTPSYAGISYERLERPGRAANRACSGRARPSITRARPICTRSVSPAGWGKFHAIEFQPAGRAARCRIPVLPEHRPHPVPLSHRQHDPPLARPAIGWRPRSGSSCTRRMPARLAIGNGDWVRVVSRRGEVTARVRLTDRSAPGLVFGTFHFKEVPINLLTNDALDPVARSRSSRWRRCGWRRYRRRNANHRRLRR